MQCNVEILMSPIEAMPIRDDSKTSSGTRRACLHPTNTSFCSTTSDSVPYELALVKLRHDISYLEATKQCIKKR
jgi:hypothetical protein